MASTDFAHYTKIADNDQYEIIVSSWGEINVNYKESGTSIKIVHYIKELRMRGMVEIVGCGQGGIFSRDKWYGINSVKYFPGEARKNYRDYFRNFVSRIRNLKYNFKRPGLYNT